MNATDQYLVNRGNAEHPTWEAAHWERAGEIAGFHHMRLDFDGLLVVKHLSAIKPVKTAMTIAEQLEALRAQILYARKKAESYRNRAAAQDAIADVKVKEAAALGTPELPVVENPIEDGKTYPQLARTAAYPPWKP